ncbi:alkaline phosphatase [Solimonas sp. K1W22B-7]|uniref:alkaline phosphatase n=1 Tax=Solimonas sp. K1W22B-7 TaxID=2303331 RepID=UPI000E32ECCE|nr:alkaline phosphatase [Solimonas sp. K1W22B-7]AXQ28008.1 alkaline phosphatase [Solimonas sp. K1W22B-7]
MQARRSLLRTAWAAAAIAAAFGSGAQAAPTVSRLTPPSELFRTSGASAAPVIARFLPQQRFDLQATVRPDAGQTITAVTFSVDGTPVAGTVDLVTTGLVSGLPAGTTVATLRAYTNATPGLHTLTVSATQSDAATVSSDGNFEIVGLGKGSVVKNIIFFLGDGMGAGHRTAARIAQGGVTQGRVIAPLAMDTFPYGAQISTASLNSIVTDSAPGMSNYVTGNKAQNNQEGVFPDDTAAAFDNPRFEYLPAMMHRLRATRTGIVTTSDVFDATPAAVAVHTANRGAGTGIVDQFFDERNSNGLYVLMGGGRKWFLPNPTTCTGIDPKCGSAGSTANFNGSARAAGTDYVLPASLASAWGVPAGVSDPGRDLIAEFVGAGFSYAPDAAGLSSAPITKPLLGLFSLSNMNVALDKLGKRRGTSTVVDNFGFPDQPLLPEMTKKALDVLNYKNKKGFFLLVEGASIDKQSHNEDSDRVIMETIEFDKAIGVAKNFALANTNTLIVVSADHENGGFAVIGASTVATSDLVTRSTSGAGTGAAGPRGSNGGVPVVGTYDNAKFPIYVKAADGYPQSMDPDGKLLVGYGANADRYEDWLTNALPLRDSQQPGNGVAPLSSFPANPINQDTAGGFLVTGQTSEAVAAHTANDIPLSAYGKTAKNFHGTLDNTDVFFLLSRAAFGGKAVP